MPNEMSRRDLFKLGAAAVSALGARHAAAVPSAKKPNILFLMTDQHRADCLGIDGKNPVIHTPNLDRIGREGAYFSSAYSCTPTCTPARAALLTGMGPWRNGMLGYSKVADEYPVEMPRILGDAGYQTLGIGKMHWHPQRNHHGFDKLILDESGRTLSPDFISDYRAWFNSMAPDKEYDCTGVGWNDYDSKVYQLPEELHPTRWTADVAVRFLEERNEDKPFFMKVSFARPHSPYDPPKRWMDYYADADIPKPFLGDWCDKYRKRSDDTKHLWHGDLGWEQVRSSRQGYYGSISFLDEQIGRILDALEARGELDNTLILMTADHGDMTGDHHIWRKSYAYESSARIPMLLRWPKSVDAPRGQRLSQPVEIRDVLPTFLDIAGAEAPLPLDGKSMLDLVRGKTEDWREYIDLEHDICYSKENHWTALANRKWKYIFHAFDGTEQLFDLENDPGEEKDLAPLSAHADELKKWRQRMVAHLEERGPEWVKDGKLMIRKKRYLLSPNYPGAS
jgi:arylsulfatase